ncbi:hypothetical protein [Actinomadura rugatobispora]|uniref:Guanylate cyclase domain-containing protein n=1 Tax=Actinomadura rugatobispora TaxID=1994 RepID=A0ABW1AC12_9ACTN|nr:hypothetical protein GCM10010200_026630 [Actinomadura rugatobispora]
MTIAEVTSLDVPPPAGRARTARAAGARREPVPAPCLPVHRAIVALDMEKSTLRTNPVKEELRRRTYLVLDEALRKAGIREQHLDRLTDRGDGVLALVRPVDEVPKTLLLNAFTPVLCSLLEDWNAGVTGDPARLLRLRMVIHAGEVHDDGQGFFGEDLDVAFRLLDAPRVKRTLARADGALAVVVSDEIYRSIVLHGYGGIDAGGYDTGVRVRVRGRQRHGWVHVPGPPVPQT